jgi:ankyrin repeat protein
MTSFILAMVAWVGHVEGAGQAHVTGGLSITLIPSQDRTLPPTIVRDGEFSVLFKNHSGQPIHLWGESCPLGHGTLSFRVEEGAGRPTRMYLQARSPLEWRNHPLRTTTIAPGAAFVWKISPSQMEPGRHWGERVWRGVPEPNTGVPVRFTALYEVKGGKAAREHGVWVGRVSSEPLEVLVVEPMLKTPHEYLWADCPRQALRLLQADPTWINREDEHHATALHVAAYFGHREVVRWLLEHGADVNGKAGNANTPLCQAKDPEVVRLLVLHRANVNATGLRRTVLEEAASHCADLERYGGDAQRRAQWRAITNLLLDAGARYDLHSACYLGDGARVRELVKDQALARDQEAMRIAATYARGNIVKHLLKHGADPEDSGYGGLPVSYFAIEYAGVLKLLFDAGANPKVRVEYHGSGAGPSGTTLLHEAAGKGAVESAMLLLTRGLDVNVTDPGGFTPLHTACSTGDAVMVDWLVRRGADVKARTKAGWTAIGLAASHVEPDHDEDNAAFRAVIRALERAGVELDVFAAIACDDGRRVAAILKADPKAGERRDARGTPALHRAVTLDRRGILKLLLDKGCNPDVRSKARDSGDEGETALLGAAFWGRPEAAKLLIEHGANVNAKDGSGVVPLHEAAQMWNLAVARLLLEHGADVNARDDKGLTPLDWAGRYREMPEMIRLLRSHGGRKEGTR